MMQQKTKYQIRSICKCISLPVILCHQNVPCLKFLAAKQTYIFSLFPVTYCNGTGHIFTEVCEGYVFTHVCHSVHRGGVPAPGGGVSCPGRSGLGVSGPGGACSWGCLVLGRACSRGRVPAPSGVPAPGGYLVPEGSSPGGCLLWRVPGGEPPSPWLLLRAVRILLECILVMKVLKSKNFFHLFFTHRFTVTKAQTLYQSWICYFNCINLNLSLFSTANGDTHF